MGGVAKTSHQVLAMKSTCASTMALWEHVFCLFHSIFSERREELMCEQNIRATIVDHCCEPMSCVIFPDDQE